jgi:hypothetical protein
MGSRCVVLRERGRTARSPPIMSNKTSKTTGETSRPPVDEQPHDVSSSDTTTPASGAPADSPRTSISTDADAV